MILNLTIRIEYNLQEKEKRNNKHTYIAAYRQWKFRLCKYTMNIILERIRENKHSMSNSCQEICPSWTFCNTIFCMVDCLQGKSWSKCRAMCFYLLNISNQLKWIYAVLHTYLDLFKFISNYIKYKWWYDFIFIRQNNLILNLKCISKSLVNISIQYEEYIFCQ